MIRALCEMTGQPVAEEAILLRQVDAGEPPDCVVCAVERALARERRAVREWPNVPDAFWRELAR